MAHQYENNAFDDITEEQRVQGYKNDTSSYPGLYMYPEVPSSTLYPEVSSSTLPDGEKKSKGIYGTRILGVVIIVIVAIITVAACVKVLGKDEKGDVIVSPTPNSVSKIIFLCQFTIVSLDGVNATFIPEFLNHSSTEHRTLANDIQQELDKRFANSALSGGYIRSEVTGFSKGSIRVNFELYFRDLEEMYLNLVTTDTSSATGQTKEQLRNTVWDILYDAVMTSAHNNQSTVLSGVVPNSLDVRGNFFPATPATSTVNALPRSVTSAATETSSPSRSSTGSPTLTAQTTQQQSYTSPDLPSGCGIRQTDNEPAPRVVGGSISGEGDWPWLASIQNNDGHFCGATLIAPNMVLTAAHCLKDEVLADLNVVFGSRNISSSSSTSVRIDRAVQDPLYVGSSHDYDFAVLVLKDSVVYNDNVFPACLPPPNFTIAAGTICSIVGWGRTTENGLYTDVAIDARVPIVSMEDCREYISSKTDPSRLTSRMFCAGYEFGGIDACEGDSGGPMMCQLSDGYWYVYGIISWGYGCARPRLPGIYAKVNEFYDFLNQFTDI